MEQFVYIIKDKEGLHARPAGLLLQCAKSCSSEVNIAKSRKSANAKRLFSIIGLCIACNDKITFSVEGQNEKSDCAKLKVFCKANL